MISQQARRYVWAILNESHCVHFFLWRLTDGRVTIKARLVGVRLSRHGQAPTNRNTRERAVARFAALTVGEVVKLAVSRDFVLQLKQRVQLWDFSGRVAELFRRLRMRWIVAKGLEG